MGPITYKDIQRDGYWKVVFDTAAQFIQEDPKLNGDQAYWKARKLVDDVRPTPVQELTGGT